MCGIAGFFSKRFTKEHLSCATNSLKQRGPDAEGYFHDPADGIGLGHRRLSILDLSTAANQPFHSGNGRFVMIYNGEVYNYKEVASKYNIKAHTRSDSEVIIEAFAKVGLKCINDLNGMFSIAIWDKEEKKLFLIRDRIGIKPLYYYQNDESFAFASELKSIFTLPIERDLNYNSIYDFLHLGYISGEETIYTHCKKLKPGHYLVIDKNGIKVDCWWKLESKLQTELISSKEIAFNTLNGLIQSSVEYCMISDVPLGVFLSGGVDSSLVASVAQSQSVLPVNTFSIAFEDKKFNEAEFARKVANHIGSSHHEFIVRESTAVELVDKLLDVYDEPYADSSYIPTMMVSKLARSQVTVALSGDGGDELFMGYGFYYWARRLQNPLLSAFRKPIAGILRASGNNRMERAGKLFEYSSFDRIKSHIFSQEQYYFSENEIQSLLTRPGQVSVDQTIDYSGRKLSLVEQQSFFDIKNYLPEELLVKTDRASMFNSLEVRVPLLDHRIVEFAINLPQNLKLRGNTGKYLLKEVLYQYAPREIFDRPKWGFAVPLCKWLKNDLHFLLDKYLSKTIVEECNVVDADIVTALKSEFLNGKDFLYNRIWALIILHKWMSEKHLA